jgi:acyl carrier protein
MKISVNGNDLELINILDTNYKDEMLSWRNQEFVRKNMRNPEIISIESHRAYLDSLKSGKREVLLFLINGNPEAVINIDVDKENKVIENGMYLINEEQLNSGIGVAAVWMRYNYIFNKYPEYELYSYILEHNTKNISLHKKLGEIEVGMLPVKKADGETENQVKFVMVSSIWDKQKERVEKMVNLIMRNEFVMDKKNKLIKIFENLFNVTAKEAVMINKENNGDWNSIMHLEIITEIEKTFEIELTREEMLKLNSFDAALELVSRRNK